MKKNISRRDFLNGARIAIGATMLTPWISACGVADPYAFGLENNYYPPAKEGIRGSHDGSWEVMHARVSGEKWHTEVIDKEYDLVIVGAGLSGLSAAYFYMQKNPNAQILILDNHDDFGGHAKRNEFNHGNDIHISYGGTEAIDTPSLYAPEALQLLKDIGIDLDKFYDAFQQDLYSSRGMGFSIVFDEANFGETKHVTGYGEKSWEAFALEAPLTEQARADFIRVQTAKVDYMKGTSAEEKFRVLSKTGYSSFLRDYVKVDEQVIKIYQNWGMSFWGVDMEEIPTTAVQYYDGGIPGVDQTLPLRSGRGDDPYIFHFPDGNASIARLLVRKMIPEVIPGSTMEDVVTTIADYSKIDREDQSINIRLNSTVVHVANTKDGSMVDVTYVRGGKTHKVRSKKCIMACYNSAIPYLCPDMSAKQKEGLAFNVKIPIVYTKVLINNWKAFDELKTSFIYFTGGFYKQAELAYPVSLGNYTCSKTPDEPIVVHMCHVPLFTDITGPEQWRAGRTKILTTSFEEYERHVKEQLTQALGSAGFDADRDIEAITVNRWPHGYSYNNSLTWGQHFAEENKPWVIGRQPFGNIHIANSDSAVSSSTKEAIKQAHRAVTEITD